MTKGVEMTEEKKEEVSRQLAPAQFAGSGPEDENARTWNAKPATPPTPSDLEAVYDVPVKVQAVLGRSRMDIGELLRLAPGVVVELDRRVGEPVDIFVNNRLIARGEVVLIDNTLGITLTEIVRQDG